jgi:hypothetical protein
MGRGLAWIGVLIFAVAWFVPVVRHQDAPVAKPSPAANAFDDLFVHEESPIGEAADGSRLGGAGPGPRWLPGWQACRVAWRLLTGAEDLNGGGKDGWKRTVLGATCLTNVLMLLAVLALLGEGGRRGFLGRLLLVAAVLDAGWLCLLDGNVASHLRAGYYLWAGSFALVGLGLVQGRDRGAVHPV